MKNLLLLQHIVKAPTPESTGARLLTINQNQRNAFIATATHVVRIDVDGNNDVEQIHELTSPIVDIQHLALNDELCLATADGDVLVLNLLTNTTESVGYCSGGIARMVWSPDQEVVAFVTLEGRLIVMDSLYSPIAECVLSDSGFGDGAFVNVGWGTKETQFHGTEGKAARYVKPNQGVELDAQHLDQNVVSIVWRGDSELFAVSFVRAQSREFKVFDKEGNLKFTSEPTIGLEAPICWRPSGTWIAIPQTLSNKYVIALFEKNGLRHREIVLPFAQQTERVVRLEFSEDSDVLAIETRKGDSGASCIYLFTICNYHWYQKQTLVFESPVSAFGWDPCFTETKKLHVVQQDGGYSVYRWDWAVSTSRTFTREDQAMVAVIDGQKLLLTAFRGGVVPPPMCSFEVLVGAPINWVDFLHYPEHPKEANHFFVIDATNTISLYSSNFANGLLKSVDLISKHAIPSDTTSIKFSHWIWLTNDTLITASTEPSLDSRLFVAKLTQTDLDLSESTILPGLVSRLCPISPEALQVATSSTALRVQLPTLSTTPSPLPQPDLVEHLCSTSTNQLIFALKHRHWLYCNDKPIATDVTSMFPTADYLLFTKLDRLYFVRLVDRQIVGERRIERGARLIVVVPSDCRTVLQMPRGNLEVIQPRVLSLCIIGELLDTGDYYAAFDLMRKQRINLNLIVDHRPALFYERIDGFVEAISNPNWLNLFLSDLEEADVTVTMYGSNYPGRSAEVGGGAQSKVVTVCQRIVEAIHRMGKSDQLVLPILTTHVKQKQLEEALLYVWNRKASSADSGDFDANAALSYLLYLVDVNELYNVALGTYDFELVKFVAARSQKDPREYLPFLESLQLIEDVDYRRYRIDRHLKRFAKAIGHIAKCAGEERVDEALEVVVEQSLYRRAIDAYEKQGNGQGYRLVCLAFGEYLREKGRIRESCLMYERSGDLKQALMGARHILDWQKCVSLAVQMGQSGEEVEKLVRSLVPALVDGGKYQEAADMLATHLADYEAAIPILCNGKLYANALYLARVHAGHLVAPFIREHLSAHAALTHQTLLADRHQFLEHKSRLLAIRTEKQKRKAAAAAQDDAPADNDDADMFSDTSSMNSSRFSASSRGTAKTHKSSRNRRKHQRKLLSLKPGNAFEDIALIDALHTAAIRAFDQQTVVRAVFRAMIDLALDAEAVPLQEALRDLLRVVRDSLDEIWIAEMVVSGQPQTAEDGPIDFAQKQDEQHYAMIEQHQRFKPQLKPIDWEYEILDA